MSGISSALRALAMRFRFYRVASTLAACRVRATVIAAVVVIGCQAFTTLAQADVFGSGDNAIAIEFVSIGDPGNPPDAMGNPSPNGSKSDSHPQPTCNTALRQPYLIQPHLAPNQWGPPQTTSSAKAA